LNVEPYRFFIDETAENSSELDEAISLLSKLPETQRLDIINRISLNYSILAREGKFFVL